MADMKRTRKYYFTVEGETEQWYLKWLQGQINTDSSAIYKVSIDCSVQKDPLKRAKSLVVTQETKITHLMDYESNEAIHVRQFETAIDRMKASHSLGKQIKYRLGYSNFTFELWIILHKADCNGPLSHRTHYLEPLNRAFSENFENLDQYKHEDNFKRVLRKLSLNDVKNAIVRARVIMRTHEENGHTLRQYKGYNYYDENPSLSVWEAIEGILADCGLLNQGEPT